jgi:5-methyltetrahydrofolate--homocysteine methyltransferase
MLMLGDISEEDLFNVFAEQAAALERGGADVICIETMSAADEAALAVRAARERTACVVACTFTFERNARGEYRTMMGTGPEEAALAALEAGAHLVGTNCGNGMARMVEILRRLRAAAGPEIPLLVHANAGAPEVVDGRTVYPESPDDMASHLEALVAAGARIVGGCCGTGPAHIAALRRTADRRP